MKKLFSLLVAMCLVLGVAAAEDTVSEPLYFDAEFAQKEYPGSFVVYDELGLQMYIPEEFQPYMKLPEAGLYDSYIHSNGAAVMMMVTESEETLPSIEELCAAMQPDVPSAALALINDLPCITLEIAEEDSAWVFIPLDSSRMVQFIFSPYSDPGYSEVFGVMISSIMSIPAE